jgi:hypothetical protein
MLTGTELKSAILELILNLIEDGGYEQSLKCISELGLACTDFDNPYNANVIGLNDFLG